jgi:hypothetical protein
MTTILKKLLRKDEAKETLLIKNPDGEALKKESKSRGLGKTFAKASDHLLSSAFSLSSHGSKHSPKQGSSKHSSSNKHGRTMLGGSKQHPSRHVPPQRWDSIASGCSHMEGECDSFSNDDSFAFDSIIQIASLEEEGNESGICMNAFDEDPANSLAVHVDEKLVNEDTTKKNKGTPESLIVGNQRDSCNFHMSVSRFDASVAQFDLDDLNTLSLESTPEEEPDDNNEDELEFSARFSANFGDEPQSKLQAFLGEDGLSEDEDIEDSAYFTVRPSVKES